MSFSFNLTSTVEDISRIVERICDETGSYPDWVACPGPQVRHYRAVIEPLDDPMTNASAELPEYAPFKTKDIRIEHCVCIDDRGPVPRQVYSGSYGNGDAVNFETLWWLHNGVFVVEVKRPMPERRET